VVVCAGPGSLRLLDIEAEAGSSPSLPQVAYFAARDHALPPVFIEWGRDMVYGLPVPDGGPHAGTYKVSRHAPGPMLAAFDPADPAALDGDDPVQLAQLTRAVMRLLPTLDPRPVATERCVYDNAAGADFVLDRVGNVVVGCGTSGHGFKFGPLLGELLADLAEGRRPAVDLTRFSLRRRGSAPAGPPPDAG
jgi:glycine/D-amino acid oxidase-like deaminating enzyme